MVKKTKRIVELEGETAQKGKNVRNLGFPGSHSKKGPCWRLYQENT